MCKPCRLSLLGVLPPAQSIATMSLRRSRNVLLPAACAALALLGAFASRGFAGGFAGCSCEHRTVIARAAVKEAENIDAPASREQQLLREVTSNTPGLARSTSPKEGQEGGGIRQAATGRAWRGFQGVDPAVDKASPFSMVTSD
eukprot:Skav225511  [mRNA]  locus=scaffold1721:379732:381202:- [translate_table: standard]